MNVDELYQKHKEKHDAVAQHIKDLAKKHNVSRPMVRLQSLLMHKMYEYDQEMPHEHIEDQPTASKENNTVENITPGK